MGLKFWFESNECKRQTADISKYSSGNLSSERLSTFEKHLSDCSACSRSLNEERVIRRLMAPMRGDVRTPDLTSRLAARIQAAPRRAPLFAPRKAFAFSGAAAALIIAGLAFTNKPQIAGPIETKYVAAENEKHVLELASNIRTVQNSEWEQPSTAYPHSGNDARGLFASVNGDK